jgi:hypothetical protein
VNPEEAGLEHNQFCWTGTDHALTFCGFGVSIEGRHETVETSARE